MICLADDSGLEIDILNKAPGIFSARWGGKKIILTLAIKKVFKKFKKKIKIGKIKKLDARFICALTIYWPNLNLSILLKVKLKDIFQIKKKEKMVLVMIQYLFQI